MVQFTPVRRDLPGTLRKKFPHLEELANRSNSLPSLLPVVEAADQRTETTRVTFVPKRQAA